jgi:hypothetical protein
MMFGVQVNKTEELVNFVDSANDVLGGARTTKNVFTGKSFIDLLKFDEKDVLLVTFEVVMPFPLYFIYVPLFVGLLIFFGVSWMLTIPLLIFASEFFFTRYFVYLMMKWGLKRKQYPGKTRIMKDEEVIKLLYHVTN